MGFFDFLKRARQPERPAASGATNRRFHGDRLRMFDLEKAGQLHRLFDVPRDRRDTAWSFRFWDTAWCASLALADPNMFAGPDGFRYLRLNIFWPGPSMVGLLTMAAPLTAISTMSLFRQWSI